jgi:hypothetical protein
MSSRGSAFLVKVGGGENLDENVPGAQLPTDFAGESGMLPWLGQSHQALQRVALMVIGEEHRLEAPDRRTELFQCSPRLVCIECVAQEITTGVAQPTSPEAANDSV